MATFDYQFGLTELVPSKQKELEKTKVSAFRALIEKRLTPQVLALDNFPTNKEVAVFAIQFFVSGKEYKTRDVDNMSKTILDCLKGKLYIDDAQVRTLLITKKMSPKVQNNFVFVGVRVLKGDTDIDIVKSMLLQQAITLYQTSIKSR